ncbi:Protein FLX-like 1 [Forsythia ovata]|uniref:Protein FLX-like 1 n=1 Tax=Forsythia ovata TaxID=205694 RepID=A0ABD1QAA5_9LAMI
MGRNRGPPFPIQGSPNVGLPPAPTHEPPFARGLGRVPYPALLEQMRESHYGLAGSRPLPPHPAIIEERLAVQHDEIQGLLVDNQGLAATHVALRQELEVAKHELQRADKFARSLHVEKDLQTRELFEKSVKMEDEIRAVDGMRAEFMQVCGDIKELTAARQDLNAQVQLMTQDLARVTSDLQQVPAIKAEIEGLSHELERARAVVEYEEKGFSENFEHGKLMENKLISMARELEKLRAEMDNAEKKAHASAAVRNPGVNYSGNYANPGSGYRGNPYPVGYSINATSSMRSVTAGAEGYPQFGPGPGFWGAYDMQRAQGPR